MVRINAKTTLMPLAACVLQAAVSSAYPTKMVFDLEDESKWDGGDGGCLSGFKYMQVDTINNFDRDNSDYTLTFRQVSKECGQPFESGETGYSCGGSFKPGDVEPDTKGRSQLNLYCCVPYGNYEVEIVVNGDFKPQEGKRIGWEIEDGQTQNHIWDTFNENIELKYNPAEPGFYLWPLKDEDDPHMANFFVGLDPSSASCGDFDAATDQSGGGSSAPAEGDVMLGEPVGCYPDSSEARVFNTAGGFVDGSSMTVQFCANVCDSMGYPYCGLENSDECYCGESLPKGEQISGCDMACTGDSTVNCGGHDAIMIYDLNHSFGSGSDSGDGSTGTGAAAPCYQDDKESRVLTGTHILKDTGMTATLCKTHCQGEAGMEVYGLEFGHECFCGKTPEESSLVKLADSFCNIPCSGDDSTLCGGKDAIQILPIAE